MTFEQWWLDLLDPINLVTESVYNLIFELIATYIFVRLALKKIVKNILEEQDKEDSKNL
jgi:hypothetical protein